MRRGGTGAAGGSGRSSLTRSTRSSSTPSRDRLGRENLFTDYTFGVWRRGDLVPVARSCTGLTDDEIGRIDAFIRQNTLEKFGPVRSVSPQLVFEIAFEGIETSARHKSGLTLRSPRIVKRKDKPAEEADTLDIESTSAKG